MDSFNRTHTSKSVIATDRLHRLLSNVRRDVLTRFCADALDILEQHDAQTGSDLMRTLEVFAAYGEASQTARVLRTHRNTVLNRVQRIQELVGVDIRDPEQRLSLHVALRARDLLPGQLLPGQVTQATQDRERSAG